MSSWAERTANGEDPIQEAARAFLHEPLDNKAEPEFFNGYGDAIHVEKEATWAAAAVYESMLILEINAGLLDMNVAGDLVESAEYKPEGPSGAEKDLKTVLKKIRDVQSIIDLDENDMGLLDEAREFMRTSTANGKRLQDFTKPIYHVLDVIAGLKVMDGLSKGESGPKDLRTLQVMEDALEAIIERNVMMLEDEIQHRGDGSEEFQAFAKGLAEQFERQDQSERDRHTALGKAKDEVNKIGRLIQEKGVGGPG